MMVVHPVWPIQFPVSEILEREVIFDLLMHEMVFYRAYHEALKDEL